MTAREGTTARPDGARFVGAVVATELHPDSVERNAFELGRDYQRGLIRQQIEALEAELANLVRRVDRLEER